ncbi:peptide ABC transporter permease [Sphaerisporangium siamense]|uniref:Peptide/nickel transport system permease protein n=1 Tax=Sphaerisporangium siamense TaxID=795645 RepID=A0A7W7DD95_9ACTN|nr:dipeptide/oligopeptide/nickel ABC transporter permease/ATP-binding protein [Sphaerisporangium siamense]MBB4704419.1 peptide/nickel transport system permease protein [Sphaerisporangium siamense]GII84897.1 peptide ABC transporter permease [Sphaerisporangium siamense]
MDARARRRLLRIPRRDPVAGLLLAGLLLAVLVMAAAPLLIGADPLAVDYGQAGSPPSAAHPLGTDSFGRDVLARVVHGGRASLSTAGLVVLITVTTGAVVGAVGGYLGGWADLVITRIIDVFLAFPRLVLAIAVAALVDGGLGGLVLALCAVSWPGHARVVRGYAMRLRDEGYVVAARCAGASHWRILWSHVLGTVLGPVVILAMVDVGEVIIGVAGLSFLGLGVRPPSPEWGGMLNEARAFMEDQPWTFLGPGAAICFVVLAVTYVGDAIRDGLDPRRPRLPERRRRAAAPPREEAPPSGAGHTVPVLARVRDLAVTAGGDRILSGASLEIRAGECVGLIGASGSGKSTLAHVLMGLQRPPLAVEAGAVELFGQDTGGWGREDWRRVRGRHVGLVTQDPLNALNPVLTVGAQLTEAVRAHHRASRARARAVALETLALVRLPGPLERAYPHQLSGGMRQRVAIAMALVNRPRLLICDEPTTALDVSTQARILEELAALRATLGIGMLFISHDLRLVTQVAERVAVLHEGRVVEYGEVGTVVGSPRHPCTRRLVAAVPGTGVAGSPRC